MDTKYDFGHVEAEGEPEARIVYVRPVAVDTPIVIPDHQTTASLSASQAQPVEATPAKPLA